VAEFFGSDVRQRADDRAAGMIYIWRDSDRGADLAAGPPYWVHDDLASARMEA
jgi:hypothetical protein